MNVWMSIDPKPALGTLYSFRRCPYAIRARLALKSAGLAIELREVALRDKPQEMLTLSPKGSVPVMHLADGRVIDESLLIMEWALSVADPQGWLIDQAHDEARIAHPLIERNDQDFKRLLDRYKYADRYPERSAASYRDESVDTHLNSLEARLSRSPHLTGDRPSLVDAALLPFVRQFAQVDTAWFDSAPLPSLRRWLQEWLASALFVATLGPALAPWKPGDAPIRL